MTHAATQWDDFIIAQRGHLLQSWAWGELKGQFGWMPRRIRVGEAGAQILFRRLPLGLTLAYIPKGPVVDWTNTQQCHNLFAAIRTEAKKQRALFLKVEPDVWSLDSGVSPESGRQAGVSQSQSRQTASTQSALSFLSQTGLAPADTIQPRTSLTVNIDGDEEAILAAMKQKTRYNIRLAQKKGVTVRQGDANDIATFYNLSLVTAERDGFHIHSLSYYQAAFNLFSPDRCALFLAEIKGEPLAALLAFKQDRDAYYFYGASSNKHRNLMPSYLIQWTAMRWAKSQGCNHYDLWGIPDADPATLEAEFRNRHQGLWGVYRFKRGFGGQIVRSIGAYDDVYNPLMYRLYRLWRKRAVPTVSSVNPRRG